MPRRNPRHFFVCCFSVFTFYFRGTAYYAKPIDKLDLSTADKYFLEINGANSSAKAYWNGKCLAECLRLLIFFWIFSGEYDKIPAYFS